MRQIIILIGYFYLSTVVHSLNFEAPWQNIKPNKDTEIYVYEDFSSNIAWHLRSNSGVGLQHRFLERFPSFLRPQVEYDKIRALHDSIDKKYLNLSAKFFRRSSYRQETVSSETQIFFSRPGKDSLLLIKFPKKHRIEGRGVSIAMWIYGYRKKHTLWAMFRDIQGRKQEYRLSNLNFRGWVRVEKRIPYYLMKRNQKKSNYFDFDFYGLKVKSSKSERSGLFLFQFCRVMVLVDHQSNRLQGYEIKDNWK